MLIYAMIDNILRFNQQTLVPPATKAKPQDQKTHGQVVDRGVGDHKTLINQS